MKKAGTRIAVHVEVRSGQGQTTSPHLSVPINLQSGIGKVRAARC